MSNDGFKDIKNNLGSVYTYIYIYIYIYVYIHEVIRKIKLGSDIYVCVNKHTYNNNNNNNNNNKKYVFKYVYELNTYI